MANQFDDFDDDDDVVEHTEAPANLRKALKRAEKERKQLLDELNQFKAAQRESAVKSVLESEGVNPKIAKFIPSDVSSPEQVKVWLAEYADVFGAQKATPEPEVVDDPRAGVQERLNRATSSQRQDPGRIEDVMQKLQAVQSREELDQLTGNLPSRFQRN